MSTKIYCFSETLAPLTQMARTEGNEGIVNREPVLTNEGVKWIACLSGNAIRHRLLRRPGMRWLIKTCNLAGELTKAQMNFLLHGGDRTDKSGQERLARGYEMRRLMPLLGLLGGALPDEIMPGTLTAWRGVLLCEENRQTIAELLPAEYVLPLQKLPLGESFTTTYQYTRSDAARTEPEFLDTGGTFPALHTAGNNQMIISGQAVMRGAQFLHGFEIKEENDLQMGALLFSLNEWQKYSATIGGQSARGHGKLKMRLILPAGIDADALITNYVAHTLENRHSIREWLADAFRPAPKVPSPKSQVQSPESQVQIPKPETQILAETLFDEKGD